MKHEIEFERIVGPETEEYWAWVRDNMEWAKWHEKKVLRVEVEHTPREFKGVEVAGEWYYREVRPDRYVHKFVFG